MAIPLSHSFSSKPSLIKNVALEQGTKIELSLKDLRREFALKAQDAARLSGLSLRTWAGLEAATSNINQPEKNCQLTATSRRSLEETKRLLKALATIMPPRTIGPWLTQPNEYCQGLSPLELVERGQVQHLWGLIYHSQAGDPS